MRLFFSTCADLALELIRRNADLNIPDVRGLPPLHATVTGNSAICNRIGAAIIAAGCPPLDINSRSSKGDTALMLAVRMGNLELCQCMLACTQLRTDVGDAQGVLPLHQAIRNVATSSSTNAEHIALAIINSNIGDLNLEDSGKERPLFLAITKAFNTPILQALIGCGVRLEHRDDGGCTALHRAASIACSPGEMAAEQRAVMLVKGVWWP